MTEKCGIVSADVIQYGLIGFGIAGFGYTFVVCISFVRTLCFNVTINKIISISSIVSMALFSICMAFFVVFFYENIQNDQLYDGEWFYENIWASIWNTAQIWCYILFYKRILCAFENQPKYALNMCWRSIISILLCLYGAVILFSIYISIEYKIDETSADAAGTIGVFQTDESIRQRHELIYSVAAFSINFPLSVVMLILFVKRLRYLYIFINIYTSRHLYKNNINLSEYIRDTARNLDSMLSNHGKISAFTEVELSLKRSQKLSDEVPTIAIKNIHSRDASYGTLNGQEMNNQLGTLFDVMAKLTVLCGLMIISTQITLITIIILDMFEFTVTPWDKTFCHYIYWYYLARNIDCIICVTCVYLSFTPNNAKYHKICGCIHNKIRNKWTKGTIKISYETMTNRDFTEQFTEQLLVHSKV